MNTLRPLIFGLGCCLYAGYTGANVSDNANMISTRQLVSQQSLPVLNGRGSPPGEKDAPAQLNLDQAVDRAVTWHPDIREAVGKLYEQSEQVNVAQAGYYPQINAGMNNGFTNSYGDNGFSPSLVLSLSQMLYDFGKVSSQVRSERAGVAREQASLLVSIDTVAHDTAAALVQVQGYQQLADTAQEQLDSLNAIGRMARERNHEGASSLSDVVQTEARIEGARSQLMQFLASLESARATLQTYLGWDKLQAVSNDFPARFSQACAVSEPDDQMIPSVLAAWAQVNQAQARLDNASAQMLPTISLEPQVQRYLNDNYANSAAMNKTQYSAWVKVEMPLYQGGRITASRNAAGHALEAANASVQRTRLQVRQQLAESRSQALSLVHTLLIQSRQQTLSERTRQLYQQQYLDLGSRPLLDVLNAEQEVFQTRFTRLQTLSQLHQLQLNCLYSTGLMRTAFGLNNRTIQTVEIRP